MHFSPLKGAICFILPHVLLVPSIPAELGSEYSPSFPHALDIMGRTDLLNLIVTRSMDEAPTKTYTLERRASSTRSKCTKKKCKDPSQFREQTNCKMYPLSPKPDAGTRYDNVRSYMSTRPKAWAGWEVWSGLSARSEARSRWQIMYRGLPSGAESQP